MGVNKTKKNTIIKNKLPIGRIINAFVPNILTKVGHIGFPSDISLANGNPNDLEGAISKAPTANLGAIKVAMSCR